MDEEYEDEIVECKDCDILIDINKAIECGNYWYCFDCFNNDSYDYYKAIEVKQ